MRTGGVTGISQGTDRIAHLQRSAGRDGNAVQMAVDQDAGTDIGTDKISVFRGKAGLIAVSSVISKTPFVFLDPVILLYESTSKKHFIF